MRRSPSLSVTLPQFLITLGDGLDSMDGKHSVFGEVAEDSLAVLRKINEAVCDDDNVPFQDIRCGS